MSYLENEVDLEEAVRSLVLTRGMVLLEDLGHPDVEIGGSILIVAGQRPSTRFAKVLSVGPCRLRWSRSLGKEIEVLRHVEPGDVVVIHKHHGAHTLRRTKDRKVLRIVMHSPDRPELDQILGIVVEPPSQFGTMAEFESYLRERSAFTMQV